MVNKLILFGLLFFLTMISSVFAQTTYTQTTKTDCSNNVCQLTMFSGTQYVFEDGIWKDITQARSLKPYFNVVYLEVDKNYTIDVIDFNYTSMTIAVSPGADSKEIGTDIPVTVMNYNSDKQDLGTAKSLSADQYITSASADITLKDTDDKQTITISKDYHLDSLVKIGDHSTVITLNDTNGGNLGDSFIASNFPTINFGTQQLMYSSDGVSPSRGVYVLWNLSAIPSNMNITNANFSMYLFSQDSTNMQTTAAWNTSLIQSNSSNPWTESNIAYNDAPAAGALQDVQSVSTLNRWYYWNVTNATIATYNQANKNMSLFINNQTLGGGAAQEYWVSRDNTTDTSKRPQLVITYSPPWDYLVTNEYYDSIVYQTQQETYGLWVNSSPNVNSISANLSWNNSNYSSSLTLVGSQWQFNTILTMPAVNTSKNVSFQWFYSVNYANGTIINTNYTLHNQTLSPVSMNNSCYGAISLNFTIYDEETQSPLNSSFQSTWNLQVNGANSMTNYSFTDASNYSHTFCILPNTSVVYANAIIKYSATGYNTRFYYIQNLSITNTTQNIPIYLLNTSSGQNVLFQTLNNQNFAVENVLIIVKRLIGSTWATVVTGLTDTTGSYTLFLNSQTIYQITFSSSYGIKTINLIPVLTTYSVYVDTTTVNKPAYWDYYKTLNGACTYTNATRNLLCTWSDSSGRLQNEFLQVISYNSTGSYTLCNNMSSSQSGALTCNFGAPNNQSFSWSLFGQFAAVPMNVTEDSGGWTDLAAAITYGAMGLFITFFIIMFGGLLGAQQGNPILTILFSVVGIGASMILGFLTFSASITTMFLGLCVAIGVEIYKMRSER